MVFGLARRKKVTKLKREKQILSTELESLKRKLDKLSKGAAMQSERLVRKRRTDQDGEQALKRLKELADDKPSIEKNFEVLHSNLDDLETTTNKLEEENLNLNSNLKIKDVEITKLKEQIHQANNDMRKVMSDLKEKESECMYFRKTCLGALEQLGRHQIGAFNFNEREPQTYPVAFSNGINNLINELNKSKKKNGDLLQYKTERESEITNLQREIGNLKQINGKFQNQATLDDTRAREAQAGLSKSYLQMQDEPDQGQCDMLEEVLRLISRINEYEEQLKTRDVSAVNTKLKELNKSLGKSHGKEIHSLNLEILKLLQTLNNDQLNKQNEVFKRAMNSKMEALEREWEHCYLLNPEDLRKNFKNQLYENVRSIEDQLKTFQQIIFDFPAIEARKLMAYKEIVCALNDEYTRLQNLPSTKSSSPKTENRVSFDLPENDIALENAYVRETLERLVKINKSTREFEQVVNKFRGSKTDKVFLDLEHKLLGNIMKVDTIQVNGYEIIREKRREAIQYAQECMDKLNDNVKNM